LQKDLLEILFYKTFMLYHHELMSYPATHGCSKSKKVGMANWLWRSYTSQQEQLITKSANRRTAEL